MKLKHFTYIVMLLGFSQCTEEISVDVPFEPQTIIFGTISQETAPVVIDIQQSVPLNSNLTSNPINDAMVSLYTEDTSGITNLVTDSFTVFEGVYTTTQAITTLTGNKYWIEVLLTDGTTFISERELLKPVVPITEIELFAEDEYIEILFTDPENDTNFYNFSIDLILNGNIVSRSRSESTDVIFNGSDEALVDLDIFPFFVDDDVDFDYDEILVRLENINSESYQFYLNQTLQQEGNDNEGPGDPRQLFATPPVNIEGNIMNISENKRALGNFTVKSLDAVSQSVPN
ncbi:MAG: DUF4249 family protein [Flavobacteriaceae bacterium]|nr:DUF4249 family protein [Flavobacteriaceae bacterium]